VRTGIWARDIEIVQLVDTFFVSAATSLLGIRLYLYLAGYPKVGGGGLHIAHMLWGGLLMVVAILVQVMFVPRMTRWIGATCGGLGFGLFIDELGKFITSDNNYFFRPTAALIYLLFVLLYFASRLVVRRGGFSQREVLVNAIDLLKEAALRDLDPREQEKALSLLETLPPGDPLASAVRRLLQEAQPAKNVSAISRLRMRAQRWYHAVAPRPWFRATLVALFSLNGILVLVEVLAILAVNNNPWAASSDDPLAGVFQPLGSISFLGWVELVAAVATLVSAVAGVAILRFAQLAAYRLFEASVLLSILVIQPFAFYEAQFFATGTLAMSLPLLGVVQYFLRRERDLPIPAPSRGGPAPMVAGAPGA
jgi:hypothetical protein